MNRRLLVVFTVIICMSFLAASADAHIPMVPEDGTTLATATEVIDPWKSWFYHSEIDAGVAHYYSFEATSGERIRFMLNVPLSEGDAGFTPNLVLMGPGVTDQGTSPGFLEIPSGAGVMVMEASPLEAEYEGFTPLSQYTTVDLNMSAPATGTYYIAVYDEATAGRYAFVTGYVEAYSVLEWTLVPFMAISILMWSGQNLLLILLPMLLPLIMGLVFLIMRHRSAFSRERALTLMGTMGGLLILGSSLSFFTQMTLGLLQAPYNWTVIISIIFTTVPLILGLAVLQIVHSEDWKTKRSMKIGMIVLGIISPFVWAGLCLGPLLVIIAGLVPMFK